MTKDELEALVRDRMHGFELRQQARVLRRDLMKRRNGGSTEGRQADVAGFLASLFS